MKKLINLSLLFFLVLGLSSCGDTCYDCTGFDDGTISLESLGEVCEGDPNDQGGELTKDELEEVVTLYEALGGTCTKK